MNDGPPPGAKVQAEAFCLFVFLKEIFQIKERPCIDAYVHRLSRAGVINRKIP